jgi:DNA repair photolyase
VLRAAWGLAHSATHRPDSSSRIETLTSTGSHDSGPPLEAGQSNVCSVSYNAVMRWDNLRLIDPADRAGMTAPLFEQGAVVRTFDTPEFRGMTFYEVRAKSIINRVPEASRVPFRWMINPYRGCSHACEYCLNSDTPILMADGRVKAIGEARPGDVIYGTIRRGSYRRYVPTEILAHWSTRKRAYRITLEDGTELIASGDHRFLTERGWKFVTGSEQGRKRRPFLTLNNRLLGTGKFAEPPVRDGDYRQGYLCGMIRGDGYLASRSHIDRRGRYGVTNAFRLALVDLEALQRTREYLATAAIATSEFIFQQAVAGRRDMSAIRASGRESVLAIGEIIRWPTYPTAEWRKGFLAGIFDAEGSHSGCIRISNTDPVIIDQIRTCLRAFSFSFAVEVMHCDRDRPVTYIRLLGGLRERLRFFHTVDPSITRKRTIDGVALKGNVPLRVVSIEDLGMRLRMCDITTGTGDFIANGVVSHNCFARNTHTYLDLDYGEDFNRQIVVKVNAEERLRKELAASKWKGEHIAMGTNVDTYQRAEGRYKLMRGILSALRDSANPFSILTKGSLILRDLDLLQEAAEVADVGTNVSVGFVDREMWRVVEPGTPSPQKRLEVCRTLNEAGIPCGVLMVPIIPFLTDSPAQLRATVKAIADAGATHLAPIVLHLRPGAREWFMGWLAEHHPDLVPRYELLYRRSSYAPKAFQDEITGRVHELARRYGVGRTTGADTRRVGGRLAKRVADSYQQLSMM